MIDQEIGSMHVDSLTLVHVSCNKFVQMLMNFMICLTSLMKEMHMVL